MQIEETIDYEAHRLKKLIDNKKTFLAKLEPSTMQYKHLLSEIEFLEQDILPMILSKNLYLHEINKFVMQKFNSLANHPEPQQFCGLLLYYHFKDPEIGEKPMAAFASNDELMQIRDANMPLLILKPSKYFFLKQI